MSRKGLNKVESLLISIEKDFMNMKEKCKLRTNTMGKILLTEQRKLISCDNAGHIIDKIHRIRCQVEDLNPLSDHEDYQRVKVQIREVCMEVSEVKVS